MPDVQTRMKAQPMKGSLPFPILTKSSGYRSYGRGLGQTVDWRLILCYLALVVIGLVSIYASVHSSEPSSIFDLGSRSGKQIMWFGLSLAVDLAILFVINPKIWEVIPPAAYVLVLFLLVLVITLLIKIMERSLKKSDRRN